MVERERERERDRERDRDRDRRRDKDKDRERDRERDRDRDRAKDRDRRRSRSRSPERTRTRHARSRTPDRRSRSRSAERARRRSHHHHRRSPSFEPARKHHRHDEERHRLSADAVSEFVDGIAREQQQKQNPPEDAVEMDADEVEMMKKMGIPVGFDSTKGKPVPGANVSGVRAVTKRQPRQYMNRRGGFNRPLPAELNR